ncbi:MAG TPA: ABC transporter ATP-binding protein [Acidothermaceae bacterium]
MTTTPAVQLRDAAVRVGDRLLWHDVNVGVPAGQFVAILGPNGVGKSTLIKAVLGVIPLAAGEAFVFGQPVGMANRDIGYLPQRRSFDASLRVRGIDVVRLGLDGDRFGLPWPWSAKNREAGRRVRDVIEQVDASPFALRPIGELSGGEQQRLLIAQALARDPRLLILDEPLDSLDLPNQSAIAELIRRVCVDSGVTVLMVAHDVNPILPYLDQVIYLADGGAVCGTPADVITSPTLSALYRTPIEVLRTSDGRLVVVGQPEAPAHHADRHTGQPH